ncbi:hypothetical protein I4U23_030075 [Adineta vaga]|nr:hypothetical protein I4U23_030075 [Adineta vaga]
MSEYNDIAGSDDIISLNYDTQETFNEHSYRAKQAVNRIDKTISVKDQAKENQKPMKQVVDEDQAEIMEAETQNYSQPIVNNEIPVEELTTIESQINGENNILTEPPLKSTLNVITTGLESATATNNLRLYISPAASIHETTNMDDAQPNPINTLVKDNEVNHRESDDKPKEEPMDTSDAQVSLGSDGIIESHNTYVPNNHESASVTEKSTKVQSPVQNKTSVSPKSKASYALSQPTTDKFDAILAKLTTSTTNNSNNDSNITIREEEEIYIKESISKTLRRYSVKVDPDGRTISRDLLLERIIEENTTTRIETWPSSDKKPVRTVAKPVVPPVQSARKKSAKLLTPKRRTKSLKPTATTPTVSSKKIITVRSDDDDDDDDVISVDPDENSSDDNKDEDDNDNDDDDEPTGNLSGDDFMPTNSSGQPVKKGLRVYAKWLDGHFYPGIVGNVSGEKCMIEYDDGAKRSVKIHDIISQSYLDINQNVLVQISDGSFQDGIIKRLIKKRKTGNIGYVVETGGKEKWYPLQFVSLTAEQAEQLPVVTINSTEEVTSIAQGKRKRTSTLPQSPNKKPKSSTISSSPTKRTTFTPTRQTKLFNSMNFLLTGFNESMDIRHETQNAIEGHGGKVIEKMPNTNRRDNVYLISDKARKTAKFFDAKKINIPCGEVQEWEDYNLVPADKETKENSPIAQLISEQQQQIQQQVQELQQQNQPLQQQVPPPHTSCSITISCISSSIVGCTSSTTSSRTITSTTTFINCSITISSTSSFTTSSTTTFTTIGTRKSASSSSSSNVTCWTNIKKSS